MQLWWRNSLIHSNSKRGKWGPGGIPSRIITRFGLLLTRISPFDNYKISVQLNGPSLIITSAYRSYLQNAVHGLICLPYTCELLWWQKPKTKGETKIRMYVLLWCLLGSMSKYVKEPGLCQIICHHFTGEQQKPARRGQGQPPAPLRHDTEQCSSILFYFFL